MGREDDDRTTGFSPTDCVRQVVSAGLRRAGRVRKQRIHDLLRCAPKGFFGLDLPEWVWADDKLDNNLNGLVKRMIDGGLVQKHPVGKEIELSLTPGAEEMAPDAALVSSAVSAMQAKATELVRDEPGLDRKALVKRLMDEVTADLPAPERFVLAFEAPEKHKGTGGADESGQEDKDDGDAEDADKQEAGAGEPEERTPAKKGGKAEADDKRHGDDARPEAEPSKEPPPTDDAEIVIDPEFAGLLPPLPPHEREELERGILAAKKCRDDLIVWRHEGKRILLDGHNRKEIADKLGLPYEIKEVELPDRDAARLFILGNQRGRRSGDSPIAQGYMRGLQYELEKKSHGGDRKSEQSKGQKVDSKTDEALAQRFGVSGKTIQRDGEFARSIHELVKNCGGRVWSLVDGPSKKLTRGLVVKLAKKKPAEQTATVKKLLKKDKAAVDTALNELRGKPAKVKSQAAAPKKADTAAAPQAKAKEDGVVSGEGAATKGDGMPLPQMIVKRLTADRRTIPEVARELGQHQDLLSRLLKELAKLPDAKTLLQKAIASPGRDEEE